MTRYYDRRPPTRSIDASQSTSSTFRYWYTNRLHCEPLDLTHCPADKGSFLICVPPTNMSKNVAGVRRAVHALAEQWKRSNAMTDAVPKLKTLFAKRANDDGIFPLFPPKIHKSVWKTVPINPKRQAAILVPLVSYEGVPSLVREE